MCELQLFSLLFLTAIVYVSLRIWKFLKFRYYINKIPGPYSHYIIGNLLDLTVAPVKLFQNLRNIASKYKTYRVWLGIVGCVGITLPEDIEVVISGTESLSKSEIYDALKIWLGNGLITSKGNKWHTRRKLLTPAFHFTILQEFVGVFVQHANELAKQLEERMQEPFIDVAPHATCFTLNSICDSAMGTQIQNEQQITYKQLIKAVSDQIYCLILTPLYHFLLLRMFMPMYWRHILTVKKLHGITNRIMAEREKTQQRNFIERGNKKRLAMLDLLICIKNEKGIIDDRGICEEVDTFMFAGHDTTAVSLGYTLMLLANHKEIQERIYEEIISVFGHDNSNPTYQDFQNLQYLELCLKESLRMYPSVPLISRRATGDINLPSGHKIPKGAVILLQIYDLHHNPDIFPNPEKFDPDRFLPGSYASRHVFAYLPFSGGPRNCIGQKFAMLELKVAIATILRKFILEPVDTPQTLQIAQEMVMKSNNGVKVKVRPRIKLH